MTPLLEIPRATGAGSASAPSPRGYHLASGSGPTVVVLASPIVRARSYRATLTTLARSFRTVVLEMPGCGRGPRLSTPWTPQDYAQWLGPALDALRIPRCVLVGHSNTGATALLAAALYPERFAGLVLADSIGVATSPAHAMVRRRIVDSWFEVRATPIILPDALFNLLVHRRNFAAQIRLAASFDVGAWARRVTTPVLLAWGARDTTTPLAHLRRLSDLLPHAKIHVSHTGRHDWLIEYPEEFAEQVRRFVGCIRTVSDETSPPTQTGAGAERTLG